ncbi:MAG: molybdate ABC transporter substrate-binding protein, partial [Phycisphaerae bacterium]|nr:molybdate ABC transporter substrate-binding protein [Phycisphaerae bacterium]
GIDSFRHPAARKVAIANPLHAPYGRAAEAVLKSTGLLETLSERLVIGENIAQTAQFVESGAADVGIIALSLAVSPQMRRTGRHWLIPLDLHPPLRQAGVILKRARNRAAAKAFVDFLQGSEGRNILQLYGFLVPENE